jgi:hypothetical protein
MRIRIISTRMIRILIKTTRRMVSMKRENKMKMKIMLGGKIWMRTQLQTWVMKKTIKKQLKLRNNQQL